MPNLLFNGKPTELRSDDLVVFQKTDRMFLSFYRKSRVKKTTVYRQIVPDPPTPNGMFNLNPLISDVGTSAGFSHGDLRLMEAIRKVFEYFFGFQTESMKQPRAKTFIFTLRSRKSNTHPQRMMK